MRDINQLMYAKMLSIIRTCNFQISRLDERNQIIVEFELHWTTCAVYLSFINTGAWTDISWYEAPTKKKLTNNYIACTLLSEVCFCFPIFPCFLKHTKFDQEMIGSSSLLFIFPSLHSLIYSKMFGCYWTGMPLKILQ